MLSVIAHLTSLAFVVWTAYCILEQPTTIWPGLIWLYLATATGIFFLMR